jgi:hypothetical protein
MVSRTVGETHAKGVLRAIELLQAFERSPSYGVDECTSRRMKGATGMADDDRKRRLLKYARVVAASAEQIDGRLDHIGKMSHEEARNAHKDIVEAIERLQTFEKLLARKIDAA